MTDQEIRNALIAACCDLVRLHPYLFAVGMSEVGRTGTLRELLRPYLFGDNLDVDIEFNRDGAAQRDLMDAAQTLPPEVRALLITNPNQTTVLSQTDLVAHRRGLGGPNLLAVEAKIRGVTGQAVDRAKLACLLRGRGFHVAAQLIYGRFLPRIEIRWIDQDGQITGCLSALHPGP